MPFILFFIFLICSCSHKETAFTAISANFSGVHFQNTITVSDTLNALVSEFVYNGGGVALGDLNGDDKPDIFFAGNQQDNALFVNKGELVFRDASREAGILKPEAGYWSSGVNLVDINRDGKLDIYVCNTLNETAALRKNLLYINQGNDNQGTPKFREQAEAYGLADTSHASHAQFFDYDLDGDLDVFIGVNWIEEKYAHEFIEKRFGPDALNRDILLRQDWSTEKGHPVFTNVSSEAGIIADGYSHSTLIVDFNGDHYPDIYVANDFESDDIVYINQQNGTFLDRAKAIFKHCSLSAMGSDVGDVNNDGLPDLFTTEMQPYYNKRKKLFQGESTYQREILTRRYGYTPQYTRNTLQVNQGIHPETGLPIFSEQGQYAGVHETDWSWATLFFDYNHDGHQDLYIANGFPKDVTDHDFSIFRSFASRLVSPQELLAAVPEVKSPNFLFENNGNGTFQNVTQRAGMAIPSFSNGAAFADLDLDGDLDLVVHQIDDKAMIFRNNLDVSKHPYLRVRLEGTLGNPDAIGATVMAYYGKGKQRQFLLSGRGYLSQSETVCHFGLGQSTKVDSLEIIWPGGLRQLLYDIPTNQTLTVSFDPTVVLPPQNTSEPLNTRFSEVSESMGLRYFHQDDDFIDFNIQRTIPHKLSQFGPALAVGDLDGDDLEDLVISGSRNYPETFFYQRLDGAFESQTNLLKTDKQSEDAGMLVFDADGDGRNDLFIAGGGAQYRPGDARYQGRLYHNAGNRRFDYVPGAIPDLKTNNSCVKAADVDGDGDLDLFVGARSQPGAYPLPDRSFLLLNESRPGNPLFREASQGNKGTPMFPGPITDALWTDVNNDNQPDLLLVGEWLSPRLFQNQRGLLKEVRTGLEDYIGWWNSVAGADLDNDGDTDYILGNFGENINFRASPKEPMAIYAYDLDKNGSIDPLISRYWPDSLGKRKAFLYHPLQDIIAQFPGIKKQYLYFGEFGEATAADVFRKLGIQRAKAIQVNWMKTSWIENLGNGRFRMHALPPQAQMAPVYGILPIAGDSGEYTDLLLTGNDFGMEVQQGKADAFNGLWLQNHGKQKFTPVLSTHSGFYVPGDGKSLVSLKNSNDLLLVASQNKGALRCMKPRKQYQHMLSFKESETHAMIMLKNGTKRKVERYWGSSFLSQSGQHITINGSEHSVVFFKADGNRSRIWSRK